MLKIIDISGYSFSGKSAVYDLLSEFDGYFSHPKEFEFDLFRIQGGILDLKNSLVDNWSPIRSTEAIRNFYKLISLIGGDGKFMDKFTKTGANYDKHFPGFTLISQKYANSLVETSWDCEWPFDLYNYSGISLAYKKIKRKFGIDGEQIFFLSRLTNEEFTHKTKYYFDELFKEVENKGFKNLALNNAFEPVSPENSIELLGCAKSIVVDRDPRDIYLSAINAGKIGGMKVGLVVSGKTVKDFIARYKIFHKGSIEKSSNVYRLNFETLVGDYDAELNRMRKFLDEPIGDYPRKRKIFDPSVSKKNVAQWKTLKSSSLLQDIHFIENNLSEYLVNF